MLSMFVGIIAEPLFPMMYRFGRKVEFRMIGSPNLTNSLFFIKIRENTAPVRARMNRSRFLHASTFYDIPLPDGR